MTRFLFILICLLAWCPAVMAEPIEPNTYATPDALMQYDMETRDNAFSLLQQDSFHQQLKNIADRIPEEFIAEQDMFSLVALRSIRQEHNRLLELLAKAKNGIRYSHYQLDSETQLAAQRDATMPYTKVLSSQFARQIAQLDDVALHKLSSALGWSVDRAQDYAFNLFKHYRNQSRLNAEEAIDLIVNSHLYRVLANVIPSTQSLLSAENHRRYIIEPEVLITTPDGIELTATIVRKRSLEGKQPTAFQFTIYADEKAHIRTATHAAARGYVGVIANTRGKRLSSNQIIPWEYDGADATRVMDWIIQQPWSNGKVLMYGGSYNGFTQWASAKHMHPALKAMAPYAAASLITGLPYENNVVSINNHEWPFYVTNNKTVDDSVYADWQRRNQLSIKFYKSGEPIVSLDKLDNRPNPWLQKWLQHPSFDKYYQAMVPVKQEYANINIPVLTVTGYFDGGQISAVDYLTRHYKYNDNADHTLLIGPYNHSTAQDVPRSHHSNYKLDEVALEKDTEALVFAWFDHVLYDTPLPDLLKAKVNYQLMGSNQWRHADSFAKLNRNAKGYYLATKANPSGQFNLIDAPESEAAYVSQTVDMTDRMEQRNRAPWPIIQYELNEPNGLVFMTPPMKTQHELAGAITGYFSISVNKKDVDIGYNFYAIDAEGKAFHLNNYRSRASYANDMSKRQLLTPHQKTRIPIVNARMTAKLLNPGDRLAIVLNVNKNQDAQVNLGSGKDVNRETLADAGEPIEIRWYSDSQINLPLRPFVN